MRRRSRPPRHSAPSIRRPQPVIPGFIASSLTPPRATLSAAAAIHRMAEDMRDAAYREGGISVDELEALGFTPAQIKAHARDASRRAHALAVMT